MKILLVEDEESKRLQVTELLKQRFDDSEIVEARSLNSGLKSVAASQYDLIIVDMTMPTFDIGSDEEGGRPQAYGGREMLRYIARKGIATPVIVLTQFDRFGKVPDQHSIEELDGELRRDHATNYVGSIRYNVAVDTWRSELVKAIQLLQRDRGNAEDSDH
jgi:CheY-like chemotaxis protein